MGSTNQQSKTDNTALGRLSNANVKTGVKTPNMDCSVHLFLNVFQSMIVLFFRDIRLHPINQIRIIVEKEKEAKIRILHPNLPTHYSSLIDIHLKTTPNKRYNFLIVHRNVFFYYYFSLFLFSVTLFKNLCLNTLCSTTHLSFIILVQLYFIHIQKKHYVY